MPDIITTAKGLTSGYVPMGAVLVKQEIHDAFMQMGTSGIELFHGYTYSAHPVAVAAALATLEVYENESLFAHVQNLTPYWQDAVHSLKGLPHVIDIRAYGFMAAIDIQPSAVAGQRAMAIFDSAFFDHDVLIRVTNDTIALSPPLVFEKAHINQLIDKLTKSICSLPATA